MIDRLDFSYNWNNKLDCKCFTTLRLSGRLEIGQKVEVWLKNDVKGVATVLDKKRLTNLDSVNDWIAYLDTGYNAEECRKIIRRMYQKIQNWDAQPVYYYLLGYEK